MKQIHFLLTILFLALPAMAQDDARQPASKTSTDAPKTTQPPARQAEFFTPQPDKKGMKAAPGKVDSSLPNVLILGDSISIAYTVEVREGLAGKANLFRPKDNCGDTHAGLDNLTKWLGSNKWDVIHFNWGLHDLCYRNPKADNQGHRDKVNGKQSVPPADYEKNLEELVTRLKATGASLIWASTTVVPENEVGRFVGDDLKYNAIAAKIMERHSIPTDDLYAVSKSFGGKHSASPGNVHFKPEGSTLLAKQVVASIETALQKREMAKPAK
ncbi:MAG: SGNH/GDSL hydrolase family protein [Verrucomicrobia bacterium]|nr:SGNH/GDSL hydrolase family protein [Verrucomicrobiota bacterium]